MDHDLVHEAGRDGLLGGVRSEDGGNWTGPVFVITHEPPPDPPDPEITFLTDGIEQAVAAAREAAAGRDVGT
jgi:hypothetical protein